MKDRLLWEHRTGGANVSGEAEKDSGMNKPETRADQVN